MDVKVRVPGKIIALNVNVGDEVKTKTALGTIEALKMEQPISCPIDGMVSELRVAVGDKVIPDQVIMVIQ